jgi:hypothetical protein
MIMIPPKKEFLFLFHDLFHGACPKGRIITLHWMYPVTHQMYILKMIWESSFVVENNQLLKREELLHNTK